MEEEARVLKKKLSIEEKKNKIAQYSEDSRDKNNLFFDATAEHNAVEGSENRKKME